MRTPILVVAAVMLAAPGARAQGAGVEVGRYFEGDDWTSYRVALERPLLGPLSMAWSGIHLRASGSSGSVGERLWGGGLDLLLFRGERQGPYVIAGVAGGFATHAGRTLWGSWSAGAGYQLVPVPFLALSAEARWRELTPGARTGLEVALRLGAVFGRSRQGGERPRNAPGDAVAGESPATPPRATTGRGDDILTIADSVVATAGAAMGTAYRLGGTTTEGFDCSGLIQYAYGRHGISVPRTSVEQARAGQAVPRRLDALEPGDILTFSSTGGPVTHVGLYVGGGRFIHSATGGVQLSLLSPDDPYGKWWWARWVGARRLVQRGAADGE